MSDTLTGNDLARLVEYREAEAYVDFFKAAPEEFELQTERLGSAILLMAPTIPLVVMNRVVGLGLSEPATEALVDDILTRYKEKGIQKFAFQLSPEAKPAEIGDWLLSRGLTLRSNTAKMYQRAKEAPEVNTDLRVEQISEDHALAFSEIAGSVFGLPEWARAWPQRTVNRPGWHGYLAFDGDTPVATGALFVKDEVGWLGVGATLPSHRNRGAQGAIMARRVRDGISQGCRWLITETGEDLPERPNPSFRNMVRAGFRLAYLAPVYLYEEA